MKHGRRDAHHVEAGELARAAGFATADLGDAGDGVPDWLWGKHGLNFLVELKEGEKKKLTDDQVMFAATWKGQWVRANSPAEAVQMAQAYVAAFTKTDAVSSCWNARPPVSAETARRIAERPTRRRGGRGRARGPRRGR